MAKQTYGQILSNMSNTELRKCIELLLTNMGIGLYDTAESPIVQDITGDVTGNLTGNVTGNVTGVVTGALSGYVQNLNITLDADTDLAGVDVAGNLVYLDGGASCNIINFTPVVGKMYVISCTDVSVANPTLTLTSGITYDGTNDVATFDAVGETIVLYGISATRCVIVENIGAVALS